MHFTLFFYGCIERRRWDSNPRGSCPPNAFRVRPVMTTSIRLQKFGGIYATAEFSSLQSKLAISGIYATATNPLRGKVATKKPGHPGKNWANPSITGLEGFEPPNAGIRIQCLTAWRKPIDVRSTSQRKLLYNSFLENATFNLKKTLRIVLYAL